ncbi:MAG: ArsB/NhaD family transporter [Fusobacterium gastrosuis]|uniref:ArsB/NhaD family transporter n=1 Tax=Fusobacterium TaxID=848 RepID=UPI001F503B9B|nr:MULTISPECIES: ArsB/NhaD family transporter [Fusobacterium]MDD7410057.1 ArsB/NhaD family transporter [Fusobacteriaceae bacterium]MCI7222996.1 ArsB/NhaD family transporter [Fusobacterium sp.]MDY4011855.1 ArsB/NhaD family transporter [Fusobacterium gastrosuis]MDY5305034.1 ArsB/NhaD family transporter [Fusobacterium gastrosuis]MDY5712417.1 ArsB/NhaD family transporter [Fusobacterium gastrosuis]
MLILGIAIFIIVFYCIITEKIAAPWATMSGGLAMSLIGIMNEEDVLEAVYSRLEILFLLIGMMMIVLLISETGVFQWFAIKVAQLVRGEPFKLIILLSVVTGVCSAFLDNVTTILLMAPVSILLAKQLKLNPFPFVITEVMSANIGGLATLIGDPTQLIIGAEGELTFNEFLINTAPMSIISMVMLLVTVYLMYGKDMEVSNELKAKIMELDSSRSLKDLKLLKQSIVIFLLVIIGFILNNFVDKGLAIISLSGAVLLSLLSKRTPKEMFEGVEWETLFFFIGLFMMIKGIENLNIIKFIGDKLILITEGKFASATISLMWISAGFTSIIGNVANAATFSKIVKIMEPSFQHIGNTKAFWWALSFGSCLGGNMTMLGSATNVVAVGASAKAGCKIDFIKFMKFGAIISIQNLIMATVYLYFRYL